MKTAQIPIQAPTQAPTQAATQATTQAPTQQSHRYTPRGVLQPQVPVPVQRTISDAQRHIDVNTISVSNELMFTSTRETSINAAL